MDDLPLIPCRHRNVVLDTTGGIYFSAGEVWDNIQERLLCLDCMDIVSEADVLTAHDNNLLNINQTIQMEVSHDRT
jgi:hypothetical protein